MKPTVNYEVQKLFGNHSGDEYLPGKILLSNNQDAIKKRIAYSVVRDKKSNDVIVKLVNLLPVTVNTTVELNGFTIADTNAKKMTLHGNPVEKQATLKDSEYSISEKFSTELPAYSLTVIRVKTK